MNEDRILEMFFEKARWQYAIDKGLFKDMNKAVMYQLTTPKARLAMYQRIKSGNYKIMPPHTAKIPKDNGDFRTVYVNEAVDRILLSIANDLMFELYAQMKMCDHQDYENVKARNRWFNGVVAHDMAIDYISKLRSYIDDKCIYTVKKDKDGNKKKTYKHTCKGNPYIRLQNENIFVADLDRKVYNPLRDLANKMGAVPTYKELYDAVREFNKNRKHLAWDTKQADAFITAYKGSGSYYTMRNLIMFHGARFLKNGRKMSETYSLKELESKAKLYDEEGWRMLGVLKQLIKDNNISVQGKILEWKKAKSENK